jgi:hypothetical protein
MEPKAKNSVQLEQKSTKDQKPSLNDLQAMLRERLNEVNQTTTTTQAPAYHSKVEQ